MVLWVSSHLNATMAAFNRFLVLFALQFASTKSWLLNNVLMSSSTVQLNQADMALTQSVTAGALLAVEECQHQFRNDLWSCPRDAFMRDPHVSGAAAIFDNDTLVINDSSAKVKRRAGFGLPGAQKESNRETAFVHAIIAAGITHTLTRNCSRGDFADCVCDTRFTRPELGWKMRGCSDNVHFGSQVAQQFLDATESGTDSASMANLHNNEAGRVAVKRTMRELCKCHGVSGSCATKTCWRQISKFRDVGDHLKKMYKQALKIDLAKSEINRSDNLISNRLESVSRRHKKAIESRKHRKNSDSSITRRDLLKKLKKRRLVFLDESPNYCRRNSTAGLPGMIGRSVGSDPGSGAHSRHSRTTRLQFKNFRKMCVDQCGFKIQRKVLDVWTSCQCRFHWCCKVECETCRRKSVELTCVP